MTSAATRAAGLAAVALVAAGCASVSNDAAEPGEPDSSVPIVVESPVAESPVAVSISGPTSTDPSSAEAQATKNVVTRAVGATETVLPEGYGSVAATITSADGDVCDVCLWLADTEAQRGSGLMGVTDLGDAVGMAFRWEQPVSNRFFMFQTPTALSIAWFAPNGSHVGQADMEPCLVDDSAMCERYSPGEPYNVAIEMFGGQLDAIGIGPGSSIELRDLPCL